VVRASLWAIVLGGGVIYPGFTLVQAASGLGFLKILIDSETLALVGRTLIYSSTALLASFLIAVLLALLLRRFQRLSSFSEALLQIAWVLPNFLYALIVIELFRQVRRFDPIFELYSMRTVWSAWVLIAIPFLTVSFTRAFRDLDPREDEMIRVLGANRIQALKRYVLPKLMPIIRSALLHQMWLYITSFSLVVILGGGPPNETLEVGVYTSVRLDQVNYTRALAYSVWQVVILIALRLWLKSAERRDLSQVGIEWPDSETQIRYRLSRGEWIGVLFAVFVMVRAMLTISGLAEAFFVAVALSILVAVLSMIYAGLVFYLKQPILAELGAWLSPMVLALAWWKAYAFSIPTLLICVLIQVVLFSPWIARVFFPVLKRARSAELEAIRTLGASRVRAYLLVEWPRIRAQVYWMMALVFGLSLSEVSTVILFSHGEFEPLAVWIQNQMSRFQFAQAFEGVLVLVSVSALILLLPGNSLRSRRNV
jgi:thiamine transport system permease protein